MRSKQGSRYKIRRYFSHRLDRVKACLSHLNNSCQPELMEERSADWGRHRAPPFLMLGQRMSELVS
jgi:hypothetical protein